jgi:hypothetical protein
MIRKYSNRTLSEFAEFINACFTRTEMNSLFLCVSLQDDFDYGSNNLALILSVLKKLSYSGEPEHSDILDALFDETVKRRQEAFEQSEHPEELRSKEVASLLRALKADGFEILDGRIIPTDQLGSELMAEVSVLHQRLQTREMDDINKILDQAHQNFIEGRHESCNAMLRS